MGLQQFYQRFQLDRSLEEASGWNPYYRQLESELGESVVVEGKQLIDLASNNYLGLASDQRVKAAAAAAIEKYGTSLCGTPIATGSVDLYRRVQEKLATFVGVEDAVLLPSGYQANNGLFGMIVGKEDLVVVDHYAHSSLIQGILGVGCKIRPFLHNNLEYLQGILQRTAGSGYRQVFIVTESVFSTDGSIAPMREISELARRYDAVPVVDDSHGIGVLGQRGHGVLEGQGIEDFSGIYTASLGKALANAGGMIGGKRGLMEYLRYYCPHLIYSTALTPAVLGGVEAVLEIIDREFSELSARFWRYKEMIATAGLNAGLDVLAGAAPITGVRAGGAVETIGLARRLFLEGVLSTPFIPPSVPQGEGKVRLIAGAHLSLETVQQVVDILHKVGQER